MVRVALVTCAEFPQLSEDDRLLWKALQSRGVRAEPVVWDAADATWDDYELALLRSPWDYVPRRAEFIAWARSVPALANPADVVAWNTDKRYLDDLVAAGVPTVPTAWVAPDQEWDVPDTGRWVIKPAVSVGSVDAGRYDVADSAERRLAVEHVRRLQRANRLAMVQPYLPAVDTAGETGVVFVTGGEDIVHSHAIRKSALLDGPDPGTGGLYRVSPVDARDAGDAEVRVAEQALAAVPSGRDRLLYARVDLIADEDGTPLVLELELTEPNLFFGLGPGAAERMAAGLAARLRG
ncbi:RimK family alpha-L-glutamate ligase [Micromonospora sp. KC723]|uniref:ATP-grasp domain-containing protein n=1 Tax=Micromonospora sp. KC723 TaxID=2530381 RepID=UPI0010528136|nr:hypothetical protein [Micromonospora sp. KC723]TDB78257.1 hypothetical protein E1165_00850 [Micromonospora sp. KC723]